MSLTSYTDEKIKKLDWTDMSLVKASCFAFGIILARLIPWLMEINIWWIVAVWIILSVKPLFKFFAK
jgi:hypothetical protein